MGWTPWYVIPIGNLVPFLIVSCNLFSRLLCASRFWIVCCVSWYVLNACSECENDSQAYASLCSVLQTIANPSDEVFGTRRCSIAKAPSDSFSGLVATLDSSLLS